MAKFNCEKYLNAEPKKSDILGENEFEVIVGCNGYKNDPIARSASAILRFTKFNLKKEDGIVACRVISFKNDPPIYLSDAEETLLEIITRYIQSFQTEYEFSPMGFAQYARMLMKPIIQSLTPKH